MTFALARSGLSIVGSANTGAEAIELVDALRPDLVLLDLRLPDMTGIDVGKEILARAPEVRVIALSATEEPSTVRALRRAGFHGFLPKTTRVDHVIAVARSTHRAGVWPSTPAPRQREADRRTPRGLTPRENEVLDLLIEGCSAPQIATRLGIATNTARSHIQNILAKLQVHTRLEAIAVATGGRP